MEASGIARDAADEVASDAALEVVQSGLSILHDGRSTTWEFLLRFPRLRCSAVFTVEASDLESDPDAPSMQLRREFSLVGREPGTAGSRSMSWSFADSPRVVEALTRAGADFAAGPTDMSIVSFVDSEGRLGWRTEGYDGPIEVLDADVR